MKDVFSLAGRKALVTGGSRGIGGAIVNPFSDHGAEVAFYHYRDEKNALQRVEKLREAGRAVHAIECDVSDEPKIAEMATWVGKNLGQVDILVNCAGIGGETPFPSITVGDWDRMLGVHLRGTFLVTRQFFEPMVSRSYGRIIAYSSQLAYKGASGLAHCCAAKAGIVGFTRALSYEGASHGVMVNAKAPGPVETDLLMGLSDEWRAMKMAQLPIRRFGKCDEIAPTALMLASAAGGFYSGQTLSPNGGDVVL
jgi:3-oxoacyl-[acyl-carrier protein] reductase